MLSAVASTACGGADQNATGLPGRVQKVRIGMTQAEVEQILGEPFMRLGPGGTLPPPADDAGIPTEYWYYGPNLTEEASRPPVWTVSFYDGKVIAVESPA